MKRILLYPHGGSGNHGCEAIVRSTALITKSYPILYSMDVSQDENFGLTSVCDIQRLEEPIKRSHRYASAWLKYHLLSDKDAFDRLIFRNLIDNARKDDIALSIGGDNYCYGVPKFIMLINKALRKKGVPTVLWGCSIEPDAIDEVLKEDLRDYKLIISRESITTQALKSAGLDNVIQAPDPAFILPASEVNLPSWWKTGGTIGINASPMILSYSKDSARTLANYEALINHILSTTDFHIALIPHVIWQNNDDRLPLQYLYEKFAETNRVHIVNDGYNAEQLKWIISQCRALITARTHASIAAYSTGVPTIVLGYSVKARGIALDLFGREDAYVLPVQGLRNDDELKTMFIDLMNSEDEIRGILNSKIPTYRETATNLFSTLCTF